jgi:hypothetical protein
MIADEEVVFSQENDNHYDVHALLPESIDRNHPSIQHQQHFASNTFDYSLLFGGAGNQSNSIGNFSVQINNVNLFDIMIYPNSIHTDRFRPENSGKSRNMEAGIGCPGPATGLVRFRKEPAGTEA